MPVGAVFAHHALEAMLKACAAESATKEQFWNSSIGIVGHDLLKLWAAFQAQHSKAKLHWLKEMIRQLNDFENIRFAEQVIERGSQFKSMFQPRLKQQYGRRRRVPLFILRMDLFDKLVGTIFRVANRNPEFYGMYYEETESSHHYRLRNRISVLVLARRA
jgi:hypothetical protein